MINTEDLQIKELQVKTIPSYEVAEMMGREHKEVLKMLEGQKAKDGSTKHVGIIQVISESGELHLSDYFIESTYKVPGNTGSVLRYHNIHVVYTREAETADQYIEKAVHKIGKKHDVTVATSDGLEQMIIWGDGAKRLSANELKNEIESTEDEIRGYYSLV